MTQAGQIAAVWQAAFHMALEAAAAGKIAAAGREAPEVFRRAAAEAKLAADAAVKGYFDEPSLEIPYRGEPGGEGECSLKVGDIVRLKSGGPWMTIIEVRYRGSRAMSVDCGWFDANGRPHTHLFPRIEASGLIRKEDAAPDAAE